MKTKRVIQKSRGKTKGEAGESPPPERLGVFVSSERAFTTTMNYRQALSSKDSDMYRGAIVDYLKDFFSGCFSDQRTRRSTPFDRDGYATENMTQRALLHVVVLL